MSMIPEDKVVWGRPRKDENGKVIPTPGHHYILIIILAVVVIGVFGGLFIGGFNDGLNRQRPPVTLLTPTTGG